jgi:predicted ATPase
MQHTKPDSVPAPALNARRKIKVITSWTAKGFKSIYDSTTLKLSPLTVFAGANSSGKSSLIQSILLTAQTIQSTMYPRSVILNGHIVRLGAFDDILSNRAGDPIITIGFQVRPSPLESDRTGPTLGRYYRLSREALETVDSVECRFSFSATGGIEERDVLQLQPRLEESWLKLHPKSDKRFADDEVIIKRTKRKTVEIASALHLEAQSLDRPELASLEYEVVKPSHIKSRRWQYGGVSTGKPVGALLRHFLPTAISIIYDAVEEQIRQVVSLLSDISDFRYYEGTESDENPLLKNPVLQQWILDRIQECISLQGDTFANHRVTNALKQLRESFSTDALVKTLSTLRPLQKKQLQESFSERMDEVRQIIRGVRQEEPRLTLIPLPQGLNFALDFINQFFTQRVRYLGPLRDEPKPVYPRAGGNDPSDIGFRGEHTAAVLDVYRNVPVKHISPKMILNSKQVPTSVEVTLLNAVLAWVEYMGVAQNVETVDKGKLGHELKVSTGRDESLHDLTHVGVGVSQVLPILVLSLLAESGSTLIFEQPELHLHPRVQTRLADFFMSLVLMDKQCIVETHSEYLINRLRFLAASSVGGTISDKLGLFFVEKVKGHSVYRDISINPYGVIKNWPAGFFDESESISAGVLRAGIEKRKRETD